MERRLRIKVRGKEIHIGDTYFALDGIGLTKRGWEGRLDSCFNRPTKYHVEFDLETPPDWHGTSPEQWDWNEIVNGTVSETPVYNIKVHRLED